MLSHHFICAYEILCSLKRNVESASIPYHLCDSTWESMANDNNEKHFDLIKCIRSVWRKDGCYTRHQLGVVEWGNRRRDKKKKRSTSANEDCLSSSSWYHSCEANCCCWWFGSCKHEINRIIFWHFVGCSLDNTIKTTSCWYNEAIPWNGKRILCIHSLPTACVMNELIVSSVFSGLTIFSYTQTHNLPEQFSSFCVRFFMIHFRIYHCYCFAFIFIPTAPKISRNDNQNAPLELFTLSVCLSQYKRDSNNNDNYSSIKK